MRSWPSCRTSSPAPTSCISSARPTAAARAAPSDGRRARLIVDAARSRGIPAAVHAHDEDAASGGWWGAEVTRYCFEYGADEHDVATCLALLAKRAVSVGDARADAPYAPPSAAVDDAAAALRDAS